MQFTTSRHQQAIAELNSPVTTDRVRALRFIKNSIIGNKTKKDLYIKLNIIPKLVEYFRPSSNADLQVKIQAAIVLGSFAYGGEESVTEIVRHGAVKPLLECISLENDSRLIEAALRALKAIYKSPNQEKGEVFQDYHLHDVIALLDPEALSPCTDRDRITSVHTAELAATIIARCCDSNDQQSRIEQAGALPALVKLLTCGYSKAQEAAVDALAYLCHENPEFGKSIVETQAESGESPVKVMLNLIQDKSPSMRLTSARCLTHLNRTKAIGEFVSQITLVVLPTLVKLLDEKGPVQEEAPHVLAYLIRDNEELQKAACDADAVTKLAEIVTHVSNENMYYDPVGDSDKLKENALMALAAISSLADEGRKLLVDAKVLNHIVAAMSHRSYGVRAAACQCTRSLSRSVSILRTSLVDAAIAGPLFKLLSDDSKDVQTTACAALCNMVVEVSPMKKMILELGGIEKLVQLVHSPDSTLRLNAIWALKNLVCRAEYDTKVAVMRVLTYPHLGALLGDPDIDIQEQALNLLRNLASSGPNDVEDVFKGLQENKLLDVLQEKINYQNERILIETLYVINNIACGTEMHKCSLLNCQPILQAILKNMNHENPTIRVACVWCVFNILYVDDKKNGQERIRQLQQFGFEEKVKSMMNDDNLDVRERAKATGQLFGTVA